MAAGYPAHPQSVEYSPSAPRYVPAVREDRAIQHGGSPTRTRRTAIRAVQSRGGCRWRNEMGRPMISRKSKGMNAQ